MSEKSKKIPIPKSLTEGQYATQEELLEVPRKQEDLYIGVPCENSYQENRIALVPSSIRTLVGIGYRVLIEKGAGEKSNFTDKDLSEAGAEIVYSKEKVYEANIIIKVSPPTLEEIDMMQPNQILISPLHIPLISAEYINKLKKKRVIALAMEYIQDASGSFPVVRILSELAGVAAMLTAGELMSITAGGKGSLLGGISGVPPAKVVILGAGMVAEYATRTALGLGADVKIFDDNIYKLKRIQDQVGRQLFTSSINPVYLEKEILDADVVIGAIHSALARTPVVVSEDMVMKMKPGAVIVDVSIDQGGCFATSEITTLSHPTFVKHDVIHYCVPNMASKYPRTASIALSNIMAPLLLKAAEFGGMERLIANHMGLRHGVYVYKGSLTNSYLGQRFKIKTTDLELLITTSAS
ncbi:MAG: alanine dehydrogenase [Saprospiraceae bacterium]